MIRTLIVDDEQLALDTLRIRLERDPEIELAGASRDALNAVRLVREKRPDLLFLDIQMPELDGFGLLDALKVDPQPVIVFVTAFDAYALRAFESNALDYLLKPFDDERFRRSLERAKLRVRERRDSVLAFGMRRLLADDSRRVDTGRRPRAHADARDQNSTESATSGAPTGGRGTGMGTARRVPRHTRDRLMVRDRGRFVFLAIREVEYVRAAGNYLGIVAGGRRHYLRSTMTELLERLDPEHFVRIHRSVIVNLDFVADIQAAESGMYRVRMTDGARLTLSRTYRDGILHRVR